MMCFSRFIILQSVVTRYLFVQKVVNCCTISCTLKIFSTGLNSQAHYRERGKNAQNGFLSVKNIPAFIIAVLLLVSVITQVVMVNKISTLERNQAAVNQ